jgi:hypothetical protein
VVLAAACTFARARAAFLLALLAAVLLGFAGSLAAVHKSYLLLIQASPYRTLWLTELLAVPLGFWGAARLWQRGGQARRCAGLVLVLLLTADWNYAPVHPVLVFLALLPLGLVYRRGLGRTPADPDWLAAGACIAFAGTGLVLLLYNAHALVLLLSARPRYEADVHR